MTAPTNARADDVLAAVRNFMNEQDRGRRTWWITHEVALAHNWDEGPRLEGQVRRALNTLVAGGTVVRHMPRIGTGGGAIWVPEQVIKRRQAQQAETERIRREADEANAALAARFASIGFDVATDAERVTFARADAERLLSRLGGGSGG